MFYFSYFETAGSMPGGDLIGSCCYVLILYSSYASRE